MGQNLGARGRLTKVKNGMALLLCYNGMTLCPKHLIVIFHEWKNGQTKHIAKATVCLNNTLVLNFHGIVPKKFYGFVLVELEFQQF